MVLKVTIKPVSVPEPGSLSLLLLGMASLVGFGLARRKK
jgi:predicted transporter